MPMFACSQCDKTFSNQNSLTRHTHNHRNDTTHHVCIICGVGFRRRDLLTRHTKMHESSNLQTVEQSSSSLEASGKSSATRQRCHTACTPCRVARIRCDGLQPCTACSLADRPCEYGVTGARISKISQPRNSNALDFRSLEKTNSNLDDGVKFKKRRLKSRSSNLSVQNQVPLSSIQSASEGHRDVEAEVLVLSPVSQDQVYRQEPMASEYPDLAEFDSIEQCYHDTQYSNLDMSWTDDTEQATAWPWLHENVFLQQDPSMVWQYFDMFPTELHESGISAGPNVGEPLQPFDFGVTHLAPSLETPALAQGLTSVSHLGNKNASNSGVSNNISSFNLESSSQNHSRGAGEDPQWTAESLSIQAGSVGELITYAKNAGSHTKNKRGRSTYWRSMSLRLQDDFGIEQHDNSDIHLLESFVALYLEHFWPLWPLFSINQFDSDTLHPLLYLTLTSIGAMYGGVRPSHYGTLIHENLRKVLTTSFFDLEQSDEDLVSLAQARLLTQVAALYFGQKKGFSYAQHLGAVLIAQARRMNVFSAFSQNVRTGISAEEKINRYMEVESRRRLAFGILRAETYTSVLLDTRPLVSPDEIDLELPCSDVAWKVLHSSSEDLSKAINHARPQAENLRFSDLVRIATDRLELLPILEPVGYELLIFGLQQGVWRFCRDRDALSRIAGDSQILNTYAYHGLDNPIGLDLHRTDSLKIPEIDLLGGPHRKMRDLTDERDRMMQALQKWKLSFSASRTTKHLEDERNSLLSSLLLYQISYLRLHAPIEDLHNVAYRLADKKPVDAADIEKGRIWARSLQGRIAAQHACNIWKTLDTEAKRKTNHAEYNFLTFSGLHHAGVVLWTFASAQDDSQDLGLQVSESFVVPLRNGYTQELLENFVRLFISISPGRWSSFAAAALRLSTCHLP